MSHCGNWEERIALAAGGDLPPAGRAELESHLSVCPPCREFFGELEASLEMLRTAHQEPLAEAHFAAVRARVIGQLDHQARPSLRWAWISGALAATAVVLILAALHFAPKPQPARAPVVPEITRVEPPRPAPPAHRPAPVRVAHRRPRVALAPRVALTPRRDEAGPEMIRLETDDPDVVIYWLLEKKGE